MDYKKLQMDCLRELMKKRKEGEREGIYVMKTPKGVELLTNGIWAFIMPDDRLYLDKSKMKSISYEDIDEREEKELAYKESVIKPGIDKTVRVFENKDFTLYADDKFFKYFDKKIKMKFTAQTSISPLHCYEVGKDGDVYVGMILPIRVSDEEI